MNAAPRLSFFGAAEYRHDLAGGSALTARAEYKCQSRVYFDATNLPILSQKAYGILDLSLGLDSASSGWSAQLWARNALDRQYLVNAAALFQPAGVVGAPRTVGLRVGRSWEHRLQTTREP